MLGARVGVFRSAGPPLWRRARADGSYASANDPRVLVGLGDAATVRRVQVVWPSSFTNAQGFDHTWFELLYLSFSILTSVGLSDLVAVGVQARSVVMVEMMTGVFYVAMVVSRMVGLTILRGR